MINGSQLRSAPYVPTPRNKIFYVQNILNFRFEYVVIVPYKLPWLSSELLPGIAFSGFYCIPCFVCNNYQDTSVWMRRVLLKKLRDFPWICMNYKRKLRGVLTSKSIRCKGEFSWNKFTATLFLYVIAKMVV